MRYQLLKAQVPLTMTNDGYAVRDNYKKCRTHYDYSLDHRDLNVDAIKANFDMDRYIYEVNISSGIIVSEADTIEELIHSVPYLFL